MRKQCSNLAARYNCDIQKYPPYPYITIPFTKNAPISKYVKRATSIEDISKQQIKHSEITKSMATEMKPKIEQIENLARLHRQTTGNEVDITMLTTKWEDMTILLRSHDQIAKEQLEQLKASLKERVKLFIAKMDKVSFLINA